MDLAGADGGESSEYLGELLLGRRGRDHATEERKIELDAEYAARASTAFDVRIIALTAWRVLRRDGVAH